MRRLFGPRPTSSAEAVRLADVAPPASVEVRVIGTRVAQIVETRPDGTKTVGTCSYAADVLTEVRFTNPDRVVTFPVVNGQPTGWGS